MKGEDIMGFWRSVSRQPGFWMIALCLATIGLSVVGASALKAAQQRIDTAEVSQDSQNNLAFYGVVALIIAVALSPR